MSAPLVYYGGSTVRIALRMPDWGLALGCVMNAKKNGLLGYRLRSAKVSDRRTTGRAANVELDFVRTNVEQALSQAEVVKRASAWCACLVEFYDEPDRTTEPKGRSEAPRAPLA